jgi:hypothetical protein
MQPSWCSFWATAGEQELDQAGAEGGATQHGLYTLEILNTAFLLNEKCPSHTKLVYMGHSLQARVSF